MHYHYLIDPEEPVREQPLPGLLFSGDHNGDSLLLELTGIHAEAYEGQTAVLSALRPDGVTVPMAGEIRGGRCELPLPGEALACPGLLRLSVRAADAAAGCRKTLLTLTARVIRPDSDAIADGGHVIPSLDELLAGTEALRRLLAQAEDERMGLQALMDALPHAMAEGRGVLRIDDAAALPPVSLTVSGDGPVLLCGRNMADPSLSGSNANAWIVYGGLYQASPSTGQPVLAPGRYALSYTASAPCMAYCLVRRNGAWSQNNQMANPFIFDVPEGAEDVHVYLYLTNIREQVSQVQLERGGIPSAYEPYHGEPMSSGLPLRRPVTTLICAPDQEIRLQYIQDGTALVSRLKEAP